MFYLQGTRDLDGFSPNISKVWRAPPTCSFKYGNKKYNLYNSRNRYVTESENFDSTSYNLSNDSDVAETDDDSNNVIQIAARSKTSRSFDPSMASSDAMASFHSTSLLSHQLLLIVTAVIVSVSFSCSDLTLRYHRLRQRLSA